jgi:hypothetical protein
MTAQEKAAIVRVGDLEPMFDRIRQLGRDVADLGLPASIIEQLKAAEKDAEFIRDQRAASALLIIKGFTALDAAGHTDIGGFDA